MKKLYGKSFLRVLPVALFISIFTAVTALFASAEPYQQSLVNLENQSDILVSIVYGEEIPQNIVFISPTQERLSAGITDTSRLGMYKGDGYIDYKIYGAQAGQWYIEYEEMTSGEAKFSVSVGASVVIEDFKLTKTDGSTAEVTFRVNCNASNTRYGYSISLLTENSQTKKELASGSAYSSEQVTKSLNLSDVATYDGYILRLTVYSDNGVTETNDTAQTPVFSYQNPNDVEPLTDADITVDTSDRKIIVSWSSYYRGTAYTEAFADGKNEPFFAEASNASGVTFAYDEDAAEITLNIYSKASNKLSKPLTVTFPVKNLPVKIDAPENTNKTQCNISHNIEDGNAVKAKVTVNGRKGEFELTSKGDCPVSLSDGINEIELEYELYDVVYKSQKSVSMDMMPPELEIFEATDNKYISGNSFVISGKTEKGAVVTVNDKEAETQEDGSFKYTAKLSEGENVFKIKTSDTVGNAAVKTITLMCNPPKNEDKNTAAKSAVNTLLPLIITLGFSLFVIILLMIFVKKRSSREIYKNNMPLKIYLLNAFSVLSLILSFAVMIVCALIAVEYIRTGITINDTEAFSRLAIEDADSATELLDRRSLCFILMLVSGTVGIVFAIISLILKGIYKKKAPAASLASKKAGHKKEKKEKVKKEKVKNSKKQAKKQNVSENENFAPIIPNQINAYGEANTAPSKAAQEPTANAEIPEISQAEPTISVFPATETSEPVIEETSDTPAAEAAQEPANNAENPEISQVEPTISSAPSMNGSDTSTIEITENEAPIEETSAENKSFDEEIKENKLDATITSDSLKKDE